ncbi:uncharacterized protein LOC130758008 [Actinidia eriantha]|uniref:uncharacterized protein LOC130758008 n=1 Tax=Actinidia eriantha TaxID=165200 RepID=UPI00258B2962|nr:uncharacterized protein LOC130758008 [Actinidia eriantha]XP_057468804.1 uncharacterized protein LOC130758008 [Actinidia eriantha]XP_057468805.1 uncharacterized protein LOC130758008 [Actinidia eriantha]
METLVLCLYNALIRNFTPRSLCLAINAQELFPDLLLCEQIKGFVSGKFHASLSFLRSTLSSSSWIFCYENKSRILWFRPISCRSLSVLQSTLCSSSQIFCYANNSRDSSVPANFTPLSVVCDQRSVALPRSSVMRTNQGILRFWQILRLSLWVCDQRSVTLPGSSVMRKIQGFFGSGQFYASLCFAINAQELFPDLLLCERMRGFFGSGKFHASLSFLRSTLSSSSQIFCYANKSRDSSVSANFTPLSVLRSTLRSSSRIFYYANE